MINVRKILFEICDDESVYSDGTELLESGILDSFAFIQLFSALEDAGIVIQPTQISKEMLKTPEAIERMVAKYEKEIS